LMLGVPLLLALFGARLYFEAMSTITTDDAYLKADRVFVSTDIDGRVDAVLVGEHDRVEQGQLLLTLSETSLRIAVREAQARLNSVRDTVTALKAYYHRIEADLERARADLAFFEREFERRKPLASSQALAASSLDEARHNVDGAKSKVSALQQDLARIRAQMGIVPDQAVENSPLYRQAQATLDHAMLNLSHAKIFAPMSGEVGPLPVQPGGYVKTGERLFALVSPQHYVEANLKETQLERLKIGQEAQIEIDAYPSHIWRAKVASVSPATGAEFSLLPSQNASGNWVKVVQRVPVRLELEANPNAPTLRAGLSVNVTIHTDAP